MECRSVESEADKVRWESFLAARSNSNFRQSVRWAEIRTRAGWEPRFFLVEEKGAVRAALTVLSRRIPVIGRRLYYGCRGPVLDWADKDALACLLEGIGKQARKEKAFLLRIDPEPVEGVDLRTVLSSFGFRPLDLEFTAWNRSQYELRVPLDKSIEEMLKEMRRKLKQDINSCSRKGATVRASIEEGDAARFWELMNGLEKRKDAVCHTPEYFRTLLEVLAGSGGTLLKVIHEDRIISAIALWFVGDRCWCVYLANDYAQRKLMPNKLAMWESIKLAKERGCRFLDLGATQGAAFDPESGLDGYKMGFRPEIVRYPGYFDLSFSRPLYSLFRILESRVVPVVLRLRVRESKGAGGASPEKAPAAEKPASPATAPVVENEVVS